MPRRIEFGPKCNGDTILMDLTASAPTALPMPFDRGSLSFRIFRSTRTLPDDAVDLFAAEAAPPIETAGESLVSGWVTSRHLLDRNIVESTAMIGGTLRLDLLLAERKIPAALLRAETQQEELNRKLARDAEFISRKERSEIKREVSDRLLPLMPPQLKNIPFAHPARGNTIYVSAMTDKQCDVFGIHWRDVLGGTPTAVSPEAAALERCRIDVKQWHPISYAENVADELVDDDAGREFLTWLWYASELGEGMMQVGDHGPVGVLIEGPLTFTMEGAGAHVIAIRKGHPTLSAEAQTCLLSGKKLSKAKLSLAVGEAVWETGVDDTFAFRSMKLPEPEEMLDPVSQFMDRIENLKLFESLFIDLYEQFVRQRDETGMWKKEVVPAMKKWAKERKSLA